VDTPLVSPACHSCGYDLAGLRVATCPECGVAIDAPRDRYCGIWKACLVLGVLCAGTLVLAMVLNAFMHPGVAKSDPLLRLAPLVLLGGTALALSPFLSTSAASRRYRSPPGLCVVALVVIFGLAQMYVIIVMVT